MELSMSDKTCSIHKNTNFSFYCFDDKEFLCSKCFKEHKKHNIEIIDDLKEKSLFLKSLNKTGKSLPDFYDKMKNVLENVSKEIEDSLLKINKNLEELRQCAPPGEVKNIFYLTFTEYEKISIITEILKKTQELGDKLYELSREIKSQHIYTNFRIINQSVEVLEHSKEYPAHTLDIMLGKKSNA